MAYLSIFKETVLPESLQPNAMYLVAPAGQPNYVEIYVTSNDGAIVRKTIGETEILGLINTHIGTAVQSVLEFKLVQDIVTRDALALDKATLVLVIDASADPTVEAGAATYIYNPDDEDYTKIAEYESLDISLDWDAIGGAPTSTPAQIDAAVSNSHTHANKAVLDELTENGDEELLYKGQVIPAGLSTVNW